MAEFELPFRFPEKVINESKRIEEGITDEEIKKRWDFREVTTFTIDPEDAKDFDDAISFRKLEDGLFEIGVHIADVTHYIKPNSSLDQEAFDRATSFIWWIVLFLCFPKDCPMNFVHSDPMKTSLLLLLSLKWMNKEK